MNKHTPGPWTVQGNRIEAADATTVAAFDKFIAPSKADAALIAASPDLLEALKDILKDAEYAGEKTSIKDIDFHLELIRETARSAITKAIGEH